jgi:hypothetical protein
VVVVDVPEGWGLGVRVAAVHGSSLSRTSRSGGVRSAGAPARVAVDHAWSGVVVGRAGGLRRFEVPVLPVITENARSMPATLLAKSPAPVASRSARSGLGSRIPAIARQTGQMQHSALPVDQPLRRPTSAHNFCPAVCQTAPSAPAPSPCWPVLSRPCPAARPEPLAGSSAVGWPGWVWYPHSVC